MWDFIAFTLVLRPKHIYVDITIKFLCILDSITIALDIQARKYVQKVMKDLLKQRISTPQKRYGDFVDIVVEELQSEEALVDEDFMVDLICGLIFAGIALTPTTLTIGMKFLTNSPNVVEALTVRVPTRSKTCTLHQSYRTFIL